MIHKRISEGLVLCLMLMGSVRVSATASFPASSRGDSVVIGESEVVLRNILAKAEREKIGLLPFGRIIQWSGEQLLGRPYAAGLLDQPGSERLILSLESFDCVLLVETVVALSRMIALEENQFQDFAAQVRSLRYRRGTVDGYCSRLHYFTEWIEDNELAGVVHNITGNLGGINESKNLNFMTAHRSSYSKMELDDVFSCIVDMEARYVSADHVYIPEDRIDRTYSELQAGDIIATSTKIEGLDVTHTGFAYAQPDGGIGFLHASSSGEVKISDDLQQYVQSNRSQRGLVVVRPLDPRDQSSN